MDPFLLVVAAAHIVLLSLVVNSVVGGNPPTVPALILLGDSILDTGNNNYLTTIGKCNHFPYGIDFYQRQPTGRWSDGFIIPDYVAQGLGLPSPLPYLDPNAKGSRILTGVNFASGGSGLLDTTLRIAGVSPLSNQMNWYADYRNELEQLVGATQAANLLSNALHVINTGTNDYVGSYYLDPQLQLKYSISEYRALMLQRYQEYLQVLYNLGGRKVAIVGIPPMGCIPLAISLYGHSQGCVDFLNSEAQAFNKELKLLLSSLSSSFLGFKLTYVDSYYSAFRIIQGSTKYGFKVTSKGCCGDGGTSFGPLCRFLSETCNNISDHFFFDAVHPTQRVYEILAQKLFLEDLTRFL